MNSVGQLNAALAGRYVVEREIGAGGMATVYLARDVKHQRNVALKVLLPELGAILGVERFQAEITVTANLQHPNLLSLFDSGEADGLLFYVMPYVEGESLRARLDREKQLPIDDALRIAAAVAGALDYAHRHAVIHRDLKPENILLHDGQPLVADFGIALAVSNAGGQRITQTGLSLGTPQYMSPEQATGDRVIDARADIYSLGAVTYEMLTGEPPHVGSTSQAIIARVLTEKPRSVRSSRPNVPEHVEAAVERALEKLPADRWATAKEFGDALLNERAPRAASASGATGRTGANAKTGMGIRAQIALAIGAALVGAMATMYAVRSLSREPVLHAKRFVLSLPDSAPLSSARTASARLAVSRDGSKIAYVAELSGVVTIMIRSLADPLAHAVAGTAGGLAPFFSPSGEWLAFTTADRKLMKVPVGGGTAVLVADKLAYAGGSWGENDVILFTRADGIYRVSPDGGLPPRVVARPTDSRVTYVLPQLLPGDEYALLSVVSNLSDPQISVLHIADGAVTPLGITSASTPRYDGRGHLFFGRSDGTLYAVPFSQRKRTVTGVPVAVVQGLQRQGGVLRVDYGVGDDGTLAFITGAPAVRQLMLVDRNGAAQPLAPDEQAFGWPKVSPDGKRIAVEIGEVGQPRYDIWVYDIAPRTLTRLTSNSTGHRTVGWTTDGKRVLYVASDSGFSGPMGGMSTLLSISSDGSGTADTLLHIPDFKLFEATIGPPHSWLAVRLLAGTNIGDIAVAPLDSASRLRPFAATAANELTPRISPDGRLLAYASNETGRNEIYVRPLQGPGQRLTVSSGGAVTPVWSPNGRDLYYRTATHLMVASLSLGAQLSVVSRTQLFENSYYRDVSPQFDVFPDGKQFVFIRDSPSSAAQLGVIVNWQALLKQQQ